MAYRKIVVQGETYEYVVGRTHTKVKGLGVWPNEEVGRIHEKHEECECCGEPKSMLYPSKADLYIQKQLRVSPSDVARLIQREV